MEEDANKNSMLSYSNRASFLLPNRYLQPSQCTSMHTDGSTNAGRRKRHSSEWRIRWLRHHLQCQDDIFYRVRQRHSKLPNLNFLSKENTTLVTNRNKLPKLTFPSNSKETNSVTTKTGSATPSIIDTTDSTNRIQYDRSRKELTEYSGVGKDREDNLRKNYFMSRSINNESFTDNNQTQSSDLNHELIRVPLEKDDVTGTRRSPRLVKKQSKLSNYDSIKVIKDDTKTDDIKERIEREDHKVTKLVFLNNQGNFQDQNKSQTVIKRESTDEKIDCLLDQVQAKSPADEQVKHFWQTRRKVLTNGKKRKRKRRHAGTLLAAIKETRTPEVPSPDLGYASAIDIHRERLLETGKSHLVIRVYKSESERNIAKSKTSEGTDDANTDQYSTISSSPDTSTDSLGSLSPPDPTPNTVESTMRKVESRLPDGLGTRLVLPPLVRTKNRKKER